MPPATTAGPAGLEPLYVSLYFMGGYLVLLLGLGALSARFFRGTSSDYFVASRSLGPFLFLMSVFGTTMTAFALVGSTGEAYERGIGVYGLMASSSGLVHSLVFFVLGVRLWAIGKRFDFITQIQFFRSRFDSPALGYLLFPVLVGLVIPYILLGILGAGSFVRAVTAGMFPNAFPGVPHPALDGRMLFAGAVPPWLTGLVMCVVVLGYVFLGGVRSTAWVNAFQSLVFLATGLLAFALIARQLGGPGAATERVLERAPEHLSTAGQFGRLQFLSYALIPASVGMFPHVFQNWLTARDAGAFKLTAVAHPLFILIVWLPCVLIGIWAAGIGMEAPGGNSNAILAEMVADVLQQPLLSGLLTAGILAAIMSSLDSQLLCVGTMFSYDVVLHLAGEERFDDRRKLWIGRGFIVVVAAAAYALSLFPPPSIFDLGVWCFSGFTSLVPLALAAVYWRRATAAGAAASVLTAAATWAFFFFRRGEGADLVFGMLPVVVMFAASTAALIIVSMLSRPLHPAHVERFFVPAA